MSQFQALQTRWLSERYAHKEIDHEMTPVRDIVFAVWFHYSVIESVCISEAIKAIQAKKEQRRHSPYFPDIYAPIYDRAIAELTALHGKMY